MTRRQNRSISRFNTKRSVRSLVAGLAVVGLGDRPIASARAILGSAAAHGLTIRAAVSTGRRRFGDRVALVDDQGRMTYRALDAAIDRLAWLLADWGIAGRDTRVGVMCGDRRDIIIGASAAAACGAHVVMINPQIGSDDLSELVERHHLTALLCEAAGSRRDTFPSCPSLVIGRLRDQADSRPVTGLASGVPKNARSSRLVMMTSGTTGAPKGIRTRPGWLQGLPVLSLLGATGIDAQDATLILPPLFHGYGFSLVMACLTAGSTAVLSTAVSSVATKDGVGKVVRTMGPQEGVPSMPDGGESTSSPRAPHERGRAMIECIIRHRVGVVVGVPAHLEYLAQAANAAGVRPGQLPLRSIVSGADHLLPQTVRALQASCGPIVVNFYGSLETGTATVASGPELAANPNTVGHPVCGVRIEIVDDQRLPVPRGVTGRVCIASPMAFGGHESGQPRLRSGAVQTADLGYLDHNGRLFVRGRWDGKVNCGGEIVHLERVSRVLAGLPGVVRANVFPVADPVYGNRLEAEVVLTSDIPTGGPTVEAATVEMMRRSIRLRLGAHAVPREVHVANQEPRDEERKER